MKLAGLLEQRETQEFLHFIATLARCTKGIEAELKEADLVVDREEFARVWRERCSSIGKGRR